MEVKKPKEKLAAGQNGHISIRSVPALRMRPVIEDFGAALFFQHVTDESERIRKTIRGFAFITVQFSLVLQIRHCGTLASYRE